MTPIRLRMPGRVSALKIGIAIMLTWMIFGGYILASVLGVHLSPPVLVILILSSFLIFYLVIDKIHRSLEELYDLELEDLYLPSDDVIDNDDSTFLVWILIDRIASLMSSKERQHVAIISASLGVPLTAYPAEGINYDPDLTKKLEMAGGEVLTHRTSQSLVVILPIHIYTAMKKMVVEADGGPIEISSPKELAPLYSVAYAIASELAGDASDTIKHYMAFKTIVKLAKTGSIIVPEKLLYNSLPLDHDTKLKIIQQLRDEKLI